MVYEVCLLLPDSYHVDYVVCCCFVNFQSYAGKYIPALASRLHRDRPHPKVYLRGIAIGDGFTDPPSVWFHVCVAAKLVEIHVFCLFTVYTSMPWSTG